MKIRFLKMDSLHALKNSIKNNINHYSDNSNEWIKYATAKNDNFITFKVDFPDFSLSASSNNPSDEDLENIKTIYTNMKSLTDSQAADERLWAGMCHDIFWDYMKKRWPLEKASDKEKFIKNHYFFGHGSARSLQTNALARLWWIGRLSYDATLDNPFELTEFLARDLNAFTFTLFGTNISNNPRILKCLIKTIMKYEKEHGIVLNRNEFSRIPVVLNYLGGTLLLDSLSDELIAQNINKEIDKLFSNRTLSV